ncbi:hypothetical protein TUM17576_38840 [Enterobacter hormaechei]|nr:phage tail protein [Enterobacter hormaechei]GJL37064.1 hypothetical protein TUM17576_38840 [Enterobacter hormaechei]
MATKYYALLTERGAAKLAAATALGTQVKITQMAVGDGGGSLPVPTATQTALISEKRRAALNSLTVDPANVSQIIAEQVIPEAEGGFWIREIGVFDDAGELIAIANCAETYKPVLAEGSGRTQVIRMVLIVSSTDAVTLKIDPSVVLATRKYVDDQTIIVKAYADDLMAKHLAAADPHTQYAPKASPTLTGTPKAPTAATSTNTTQIATTAFVQAVIAQLIASSPATLDTLNELAAALGNDPNFATTMTNALALKAPLASPALTGAPTAPTAAASTNTTQLATTAFVQAAIAQLVASSPATLDTLNELAAALGNDPNFATTVTSALSLKAPSASPTFTGTPTVPTADVGTSTTQIASTAYVLNALSNIGLNLATQTVVSAFNWQTATFASGLSQAVDTATWLNAPSGLTFTAGDVVAINGLLSRTTSTRFVVEVVSQSTGSGNRYKYLVTINGAPGSRTFYVSQEFTSDSTTVIPIANGGTGATTAAAALGALGGAPLASPALTGTPTAPTAATATNSMQVATTAFVKAITNLLAPLASPALTGVPTAPTAAVGDNSTQLATTSFVNAAINALAPTGSLSSGYIRIPMYNGTTVETLILQWMVAPALAAGGNSVISFPLAFPNTLRALSATGGATAAGVPGINTFSIDKTSCRIWNQSSTVSTQIGALWALGS